jgi:mRNA-degrading endonuclease RelE of RelBE toxin-antitoxin system
MRVEFSPTALRNIQNLPEKIAMACVEFIYGPLAEKPRQVGKPLRGELTLNPPRSRQLILEYGS